MAVMARADREGSDDTHTVKGARDAEVDAAAEAGAREISNAARAMSNTPPHGPSASNMLVHSLGSCGWAKSRGAKTMSTQLPNIAAVQKTAMRAITPKAALFRKARAPRRRARTSRHETLSHAGNPEGHRAGVHDGIRSIQTAAEGSTGAAAGVDGRAARCATRADGDARVVSWAAAERGVLVTPLSRSAPASMTDGREGLLLGYAATSHVRSVFE